MGASRRTPRGDQRRGRTKKVVGLLPRSSQALVGLASFSVYVLFTGPRPFGDHIHTYHPTRIHSPCTYPSGIPHTIMTFRIPCIIVSLTIFIYMYVCVRLHRVLEHGIYNSSNIITLLCPYPAMALFVLLLPWKRFGFEGR